MSTESKFKPGDKVKHKTTNDFEMVVTGYCQYIITDDLTKIGQTDTSRPKCKYYDIHKKNWTEECFFDYELILIQD